MEARVDEGTDQSRRGWSSVWPLLPCSVSTDQKKLPDGNQKVVLGWIETEKDSKGIVTKDKIVTKLKVTKMLPPMPHALSG